MLEMSKQQTRNSSYITLLNTFNTYDNKHNLTQLDFKLIVNTFFYTMKEQMIYEAKNFVFPKKLGTVGVRKKKQVGKGIIDYQLYRTTGVKARLKNNHSEQYIAMLHWDKYYRRFDDLISCVFNLKTARDFARELARHIKTDNAISKYYDK